VLETRARQREKRVPEPSEKNPLAGRAVLEEFADQHKKEIQQQLSESAFMKDLHMPISQAKVATAR
jgi:hypothetical protein